MRWTTACGIAKGGGATRTLWRRCTCRSTCSGSAPTTWSRYGGGRTGDCTAAEGYGVWHAYGRGVRRARRRELGCGDMHVDRLSTRIPDAVLLVMPVAATAAACGPGSRAGPRLLRQRVAGPVARRGGGAQGAAGPGGHGLRAGRGGHGELCCPSRGTVLVGSGGDGN